MHVVWGCVHKRRSILANILSFFLSLFPRLRVECDGLGHQQSCTCRTDEGGVLCCGLADMVGTFTSKKPIPWRYLVSIAQARRAHVGLVYAE